MKCKICQSEIKSLNDCPEIWIDGNRIIICNNQQCLNKLFQKQKEKFNKKIH